MVLGQTIQLKQHYRFSSKVQEATEEKGTCLEFFLDLTKAYDVLNHKVLLSKLNSYGIRGVANLWFESYLSHRKQCMEINSRKKRNTCLDYTGN
jgi:hypothetical protein